MSSHFYKPNQADQCIQKILEDVEIKNFERVDDLINQYVNQQILDYLPSSNLNGLVQMLNVNIRLMLLSISEYTVTPEDLSLSEHLLLTESLNE